MPADKGFTLVETMVALALTAALLTAVYSTLRVGTISSLRVSSTLAENDSERTFNYFIRNLLRHADVRSGVDFPSIIGEQESMRIRARHLRGNPAPRTFDLGIIGGPDSGTVLGIRESSDDLNTLPVSEMLLGDLASLAFSYFGTVEGGTDAAWHNTWHSSDRPPQMVRIKFHQRGKPERELYLAVAGAMGHSAYGGK